MSLPRRARTACVVVMALLLGVLASDVAGLPGCRMPATVEIPYARAGGVAVTQDSARRLGYDLAAAVARYLEAP